MKIFSLLFLVLIGISFVSAVPQLPMIISGDAYINGKLARIGTEISARISDEEIEKTEVGGEGKFNFLLQKLDDGQEVRIYVDGIFANETIYYKSGDFQQLTLKVEKSYIVYYLSGGMLLMISAGLIWRKKSNLKRKRK